MKSSGNCTLSEPVLTTHHMAPGIYKGNCHCALIRYTVTLPEALAPEGEGTISRCNCSICTKNGPVLPPPPSPYSTIRPFIRPRRSHASRVVLFYPKREDVVLRNGSDSRRKAYLMAGVLPHRFRPECSSSVSTDSETAHRELMRSKSAILVPLGELDGGVELTRTVGVHVQVHRSR